MLLLLLPSCGGRAVSDSFNIALSQEPPVLDVMLNSSISGKMIAVGNVYEKLLVLDAEGMIRPELAESYTLSEDRKELSFILRDDVIFHNGDILSASDAASSMNRWLDAVPAALTASGGAYFTVSDERTIAIRSDSDLSFLPIMMASSPQSAVIMPEECIDKAMENGLVTEYIGTGPYEFVEWRSGEYIELKAFDGYKSYSSDSSGIWGRKDCSSKILRYYFVPDETTRVAGLEGGIYDAIDCVPSDDVERIEKEGFKVLQGGENGSIVLVFNKKEGKAADKLFRQAVSLIADRDTLMRSCYGDYGFSLHSDYMEAEQRLWAVDSAEDPYGKMDAEKGMALLSGSSYDGTAVEILTSNLTNLDRIAVALASCLERAGVDADVRVLDWASFLEKRKDPSSWDIYVSAMSKVPVPQLKTYLSPSFPGWFDDPELSEKLGNLSSGTVEDAAEEWKNLQKELWEYVPVMVPGHYSTIFAVSPDHEGVIIDDGFYFWNME